MKLFAFTSPAQGFSLVELMVTVALVGILVSIGAPAYRTMIEGQRVKSATVDLHSALVLTRSEAVKFNKKVTLSPAADGWSSGWSVASPIAGEPALLTHSQSSGVAITGPAGAITFSASGRTLLNENEEFEVTSDEDTSQVRCVQLDASGRASSKTGGC